MSRLIKFRGMPIEDYGDVKWFYGNAVVDYENKIAYIEADGQGMVPVKWETVGQYTGLLDQKGKEIYEGDVIRITFDTNYAKEPYYIGEVVYGAEEGYPAFDLAPWIDCGMNALSWLKSESDESVKCYEIIGNINEQTHPSKGVDEE